MSEIRESDFTARETDPLLSSSEERFPALYGQQDEGEGSLEFDEKNSIQSVLHARERVFRVATCCLVACLASLLVGMALGFSSATLVELKETPSTKLDNTTSTNLFAVSRLVTHSHAQLVFTICCKSKSGLCFQQLSLKEVTLEVTLYLAHNLNIVLAT